MDWQPIETAPKDGTWVLITGGDVGPPKDVHEDGGGPCVVAYYEEGRFEEAEGGWLYAYWDSEWRSAFTAPTHWMPLPALGTEAA